MAEQVDTYNPTYRNFGSALMEQIRRETYGEDIGQNSWLTADEFRRFLAMLAPTPRAHVLEIACGSGGPALFMARTTGCHVTGVDINENGIAYANRTTLAQGPTGRARFQLIDASRTLPFADASFDILTCIDSINHLPDRPGVFRDWHRIIKPGGRILFTDPTIITGILTNEEISIRSSIGYFLFTPPGENERLLTSSGFELESSNDVTSNTAIVSQRRREARQNHRDELIIMEDRTTFEAAQRFLEIVHLLSSEKRLSRMVFVARKPG